MLRIGAAIVALCCAALGQEAAAQTTLRFAHTQPTSDTHHLAAIKFAELVEQAAQDVGELLHGWGGMREVVSARVSGARIFSMRKLFPEKPV